MGEELKPTQAHLAKWLIEEMENSGKCYELGRAERRVFDLILGYFVGAASMSWLWLFS